MGSNVCQMESPLPDLEVGFMMIWYMACFPLSDIFADILGESGPQGLGTDDFFSITCLPVVLP